MNKDIISSFKLNSVDHDGNDIIITCEGVDDQKLAHFGGLDLHVKAVKTLISNTNGMDFAEKNGDYLIKDKVIALYLNEIGQFIRDTSHSQLSEMTNLELVKSFLENGLELKEVVFVVDEDNRKIQASEEAMKAKKIEEEKFWKDIMNMKK